MKIILTRFRLRVTRLQRVFLGLALLGCTVFEATVGQAEPRIFVADRCLKVTITGPSEGIVDRPVEFCVVIENGASIPSGEMDLMVFSGRPDFNIILSEKEERLFALREMTGLDAEPSAPAWRKLLAR